MSFEAIEDTLDIPEEFLAILDQAKSEKEKHLQLALWFHIGFLNGGFQTTFENQKQKVPYVIEAFKQIGILPAATVVELAFGIHSQKFISKKQRLKKIAELGEVYVSMTYDLPYGSSHCRDNPEFPTDDSDWIMRLALKYTRDNIHELPQFRKALSSSNDL